MSQHKSWGCRLPGELPKVNQFQPAMEDQKNYSDMKCAPGFDGLKRLRDSGTLWKTLTNIFAEL